MDKDEAVAFPEDLSGLSAKELAALESQATAEFDSLMAGDVDEPTLERLETLATGVEKVRGFRSQKQATFATNSETLKDRMNKAKALPLADEDETEETAAETDKPVAATAETKVAAEVEPAKRTPVRPSLATASDRAPAIPERNTASSLIITAAAPSSGISIGQQFTDMDQLVASVQSTSRSLAVTSGQPSFLTVATIANQFDEVIDGDRTTAKEFEELARSIRTPDRMEAIVAGGGWCAPSEQRYNFFNLSCQDGMIDLPTFGVKRGGVKFPVSPSLSDVFTGSFTNATNPWLWTEADDILTVTGSPNKPCVRVPCATFDERRLECYGICVTAGNLTDNAWPEQTRNFISLIMSAHYHAMNARYITQMVALSTSAIVVASGSGQAISADLPDYIALAAQDYRTRFGMCSDDVLEVVLPIWVKDAIRSDFSRRTGVEYAAVSDSMINSLFSVRSVRIQWVSDWQVRSTGQPGQASASALTAWPDTVDFMIYAAGTFMLGNGMTLDLGVVRDSVLNAENDHTAAWSEECHLIAKFGWESRLYRVPVCVAGRTGSANITDCHVL